MLTTVLGLKMMTSERKEYAELMFSQHPEFFPKRYLSPILRGCIEIGMTPFEAKLAQADAPNVAPLSFVLGTV